MVPPCCGWGWHTNAASRAAPFSGSSSSASSLPAGPVRNSDSIRLATPAASVRPEIGELHVDAEVGLAQQLDHLLQRIAILAGDPHQIALDRRLHLFLAVLDDADDLAGLFEGD